MKQIIIEKPGGHKVLTIHESENLVPKDDQYLIDVHYAGVNYADIIAREGYYAAARGKYPLVVGFEYSGVITKSGKDTHNFKVGDEVCGFTLFGAYTNQIVSSDKTIRKIPRGWSLQQSAGLLVTNMTAFHALRNIAHVQKGEILLIHSAAGGVGTSLIQQAKDYGCNVVAVVGSAEKIPTAKSVGADHVVVKSRRLWSDVDTITPLGIDVVFDPNGITTPKQGYARLKAGGRLVVYGFAELFPQGKRPNMLGVLIKALRLPRFGILNMTSTNRAILGLNLAFLSDREDLTEDALDYIIEKTNEGVLCPVVTQVIPYTEVSRAHRLMESGKSVGKIVLDFTC